MAENRGAIRVVIEAVDRATAPIRRLGTGIRGLLRGLELEKAREQIGRVARGFVDVAKAATAMAGKIVAAGSAAAIALGAITRGVAETTAAQTRSARAVNMSLASFQGLAHAAQLVGGSSDEMGAALSSLQGKALEAARGNGELRRAFRLMGVQIRDARGQMRPTADIMDDVADAFARVPDSARRTEAAMILFGEAAIGLLPLLRRGAAGMQEAREDARRLGLTMTQAEQQSLAGFSRGMVRVRGSILGVQNAIATRLAPIITPLLNDWADWIAANRELIATKIEEYIRAIPGVIAELRAEAESLWEKLRPIVTLFGDLVTGIGPLHAALGGLFLLLGGAGLISSIVSLGSAIAGLGAALLANPIGAAALVIAGAAYLIYRNWDEIVDFFQGIWDGVKDAFNRFLNSDQVQLWGRIFGAAARGIMAAWRPVREFFDWVVDGIAEAFEWVWEKIKPIVDAIEAAARFARSLERTGSGSDPQRQQQQRANESGRGAAMGDSMWGPMIDPDTGEEAFPNRVQRPDRGRPGQPPPPPAPVAPPSAPPVQPV
ncbi:phage tail tape measure protein, partial [Roseomonas terrae]